MSELAGSVVVVVVVSELVGSVVVVVVVPELAGVPFLNTISSLPFVLVITTCV